MIDNKEEYLEEIRQNRDGLHELLDEAISIRKRIKDILPESKDFSKRFLLETRMKTITEVIKTELDIRKHIEQSVKTECDLNFKVEKDQQSNISISDLVDAIEVQEKNKKGDL
jgi:hypothetical protein